MRIPCIIPITDGPMGYGISPINDCGAGYIIYQCPRCGRMERQALIGTYQINTTCICNFPTCVYMMNIVGSWKHPNWIEFDERSYWEDKGLITDEPYIPYFIKTEEELWIESLKKSLPLAPSTGRVLNANHITEEKPPSLILRMLSMLLGKGKLLPQ